MTIITNMDHVASLIDFTTTPRTTTAGDDVLANSGASVGVNKSMIFTFNRENHAF